MNFLFSIFKRGKSLEDTPELSTRKVNDLLPQDFRASDQRPFHEIINSYKNDKTQTSQKQYKINKTHKNQITKPHKNQITRNDKKEHTFYTKARTDVKLLPLERRRIIHGFRILLRPLQSLSMVGTL